MHLFQIQILVLIVVSIMMENFVNLNKLMMRMSSRILSWKI
jgi:hypothetical protein